MKTLNKPAFAKGSILLCISFFIVQYVGGQARWNVKMTASGTYVVEITPSVHIEQVECGILLSSPGNQPVKRQIKFTNKTQYTLSPGKTYSKKVECDKIYTSAKGYLITGKKWTGAGDKADGVVAESFTFKSNSGSSLTSGQKITIKETENVSVTFPKPGKQYVIKQFNDQKVMTVFGAPNDTLASIEQMVYRNIGSQLWTFTALSGSERGYFLIHPAQSRDMCLEARPRSLQSGPQLVQQPCSQREDQKWKFIKHGNNYFIQPKTDMRVLTSYGLVSGERMQISLAENQYRYTQQWVITER